jgi:hypothetical protein
MNQYYNISASGDSTAASQFFSQNANVLGPAFDLEAQHANALRSAKGELQMQGYPTETPQVTALLDSMPSGSSSADKKARSEIINNNPEVNQYLANTALYESLNKGAQFQYQNPADMSATEGQNINANNNQAGQEFLKDTASLGNYDIGKNASGQYDFMQNGSLGAGYSSSSGSGGSSKSNPLVAMPPWLKNHRVKIGKPPRIKRSSSPRVKSVRPMNHKAIAITQNKQVGKPGPLKISAS